MAGNQLGKSHAGALETACHLTGRYPDWWKGHRFSRGIKAWASGVTKLKTRDNVQLKLMGKDGAFGTGFIPKDCIIGAPVMSRGTTGLIDYMRVKHESGDESTLHFMSYEMSTAAWSSDTLNWIWFDEEPPAALYTEGMARLTATKGHYIMTFTPLLGMSEVVRHFFPRPDTAQRWMIRMELTDAGHISEEEAKVIISRYPIHERKARTLGLPVLGSGMVFPVEEENLLEKPFPIPDHWRRIVGLDIGGAGHPTAACWLAHDADQDVVHVYDTYRVSDPSIAVHAASIRLRDDTAPVAWPRDAHQQARGGDRDAGLQMADIYRNHGLRMLDDHAQFEDGSVSVEAGIAVMLERMQSGRWKVFQHLEPWLEEFRTYHRKEGLIQKDFDDLLDASRYGLMMLRDASAVRNLYTQPMTAESYNPLARTQ
jgi:phage terminase large subunit-like protein